jgi:hypothetical protein
VVWFIAAHLFRLSNIKVVVGIIEVVTTIEVARYREVVGVISIAAAETMTAILRKPRSTPG